MGGLNGGLFLRIGGKCWFGMGFWLIFISLNKGRMRDVTNLINKFKIFPIYYIFKHLRLCCKIVPFSNNISGMNCSCIL